MTPTPTGVVPIHREEDFGVNLGFEAQPYTRRETSKELNLAFRYKALFPLYEQTRNEDSYVSHLMSVCFLEQ